MPSDESTTKFPAPRVEDRVAGRFPDLRGRAGGEAPSWWTKTRQAVGAAIGDYPAAALAIALFAGIAFGVWIKRK